MANALTRLWWLIKHGPGWQEVHRSMPHERLGELHYVGHRSRPGGHVTGYWKVRPPGFDAAFGVDFPTQGGEPSAEGLAQLEALLSDLDGLFDRSRTQVRQAYEQFVEQPMPGDWRAAFQLNHIQLPDPEEPDAEWQVMYWCEAAEHWFVIDFRGEAVTYVEIEG